ncbi:hypothetical protein [Bradyrhizobium ivorense]|nr:hypothetical protein [Bradyrhizobium ivorense]
MRDPDAVDAVLRQILSNKDYRREFDYRIDDDPEWEKAAWHLGSRPTAH